MHSILSAIIYAYRRHLYIRLHNIYVAINNKENVFIFPKN